MAAKFQELTQTDAVRRAQEHYYGKTHYVGKAPGDDALTEEEIDFIESRDSFYMATISEAGWPYIQHRGGAPGFLHVLSPSSLAFADLKGTDSFSPRGILPRQIA